MMGEPQEAADDVPNAVAWQHGSRAFATETTGEDIAGTLEQLIRVHFSQSFRSGLKPAQWHALRYFATASPEARTVTAFARHRASTMGTASTTISTLVRKGYLARNYGQGVPRNRGLYITDGGRELLAQDPIQNLVNAINRLNRDERGTLDLALRKLVADMVDAPDHVDGSAQLDAA